MNDIHVSQHEILLLFIKGRRYVVKVCLNSSNGLYCE